MSIRDAVDLFLDSAAARLGHPAIAGRERSLTYAGFEARVRHFAAVFARVPAPA